MRAENEPRYSIYGRDWDFARARCEALGPPGMRGVYVGLLDYLEEGWAILRPLSLAADGLPCRHPVTDFVLSEIVDVYRGIAARVRDTVPLLGGFFHRNAEEGDTEAELVQRLLAVLRLAAAHPECPETVRGLAEPASLAFDVWTSGFSAKLNPVEEAEGWMQDQVDCRSPIDLLSAPWALDA